MKVRVTLEFELSEDSEGLLHDPDQYGFLDWAGPGYVQEHPTQVLNVEILNR